MKNIHLLICTSFTILFISSGIWAQTEPASPDDPFSIFEQEPPSIDENEHNKVKEGHWYTNLVTGTQVEKKSIWLPDTLRPTGQPLIDPLFFIALIQHQNSFTLSPTISLKLDLALHTTNQGSNILITSLSNQSLTTARAIQPQFRETLSFTRLLLYETAFQFQTQNRYFLKLGLLPAKQGNSFYKNPVSFPERYLPPLNYLQEYSAVTFPAVQAEITGSKYNASLLYIPWFQGGEHWENLKNYFGYLNHGHLLMVKNSYFLQTVDLHFYLFSELGGDDFVYYDKIIEQKNHYGLGIEISWRPRSDLNIYTQAMVSNGKTNSNALFNNNRYQYVTEQQMFDRYFIESIATARYSGISQMEFGFSYYYNGNGLSTRQYNTLVEGASWATEVIATGNAALFQDAVAYLNRVLLEYDPFALGRHFIFSEITMIFSGGRLVWSIVPFIALTNLSLMATSYLSWDIDPNTKLYVQALAQGGKKYSVFNESPLAGSLMFGLELHY